MAQKTSLSVLVLPGPTHSFVPKAPAAVPAWLVSGILTSAPIFSAVGVGLMAPAAGIAGSDTDICKNGAFDDDSIWDYGSIPLWSWQAPGKARFESTAFYSYDTMSQAIAGVRAGRTYMVVYTILSITPKKAAVTPGIGGVDGATQTTPGTKTDIITATDPGDLEFYADSLYTGDYVEIDNVYVYDLTALEVVGALQAKVLYDSEVECNG